MSMMKTDSANTTSRATNVTIVTTARSKTIRRKTYIKEKRDSLPLGATAKLRKGRGTRKIDLRDLPVPSCRTKLLTEARDER